MFPPPQPLGNKNNDPTLQAVSRLAVVYDAHKVSKETSVDEALVKLVV